MPVSEHELRHQPDGEIIKILLKAILIQLEELNEQLHRKF